MWLEKITFKWHQNLIPFPGFIAVAIFPIIFINKTLKEYYDEYDNGHEMIHIYQQFEVLVVSFITLFVGCMLFDLSWWCLLLSLMAFYVLYLVFWVLKGFSYYNNPFELEAYENQYNVRYTKTRSWFSWLKYIC